jgi:hypothetical protein
MSSLQQNSPFRQDRFCLEARGVGREWEGAGGRGRNDSNNVCTYEHMNKEKNNLC